MKYVKGSVAIDWMALVISISIVLLLTVVIPYTFDKHQCSVISINVQSTRETTGIPTKYKALSCYVNSNGKWMPYSEYEKRAITNEK